MLDFYDKYFSLLKTFKGRLFFSTILFLLFFLFLMAVKGPDRFIYDINYHFLEFLSFAGLIIFIIFVVVSLIHLGISQALPQWRHNKKLRLSSFLTLYWAFGFLGFLLIFEPFGSSINDSELLKIILIFLFPPAFLGSAVYIYDKHIR